MDNVAAQDLNPQLVPSVPSEGEPQMSTRGKLLKRFIPILLVLLAVGAFFILGNIKKIAGPTSKVAEKFTLVESSPKDQDNVFPVVGQPTFVFSKKIGVSESALTTYFKISPEVPGKWHVEKNGQVVYFSSEKKGTNDFPNTFSYNTVYTITVDKKLRSFDNQTLSEDAQVVFRTKQNPLFAIEPTYKLLVVAPNQPTTITFTNYYSDVVSPSATYDLLVQPATKEQLLTYLQYKKSGGFLYQFKANDGKANATQLQVPLTADSLSQNTYRITLDKEVFAKPGLYFVTIKNENGSEDLFVNASNHVTQIFNDADDVYTWTTDRTTGKSLSGVTAEFYQVRDKISLLDSLTSTGDVTKSKKASFVDFVITEFGQDIAVTYTRSYYTYATSTNTYRVFSYSDRPVYRPGDTVHYKAVIRKKENGGYVIPKGTLYLKVQTENYSTGANDIYTPLTIDGDGTVIFDAKLPKMTQNTYTTISLSSKDIDGAYQQIDSFPVTIMSYRKPDMDISATALEKEYVSSDSAHFTILAKTNFGQPISNTAFSYRVLLTDFSEIKDRTGENVEAMVSGYYGYGESLASGSGTFDDKGIGKITFSTSLPSSFEQSQIATLEITPNIGAAPSIGKIARLVHRGEVALFFDKVTVSNSKEITGLLTALNHEIPRQPIVNQQVELSLYKIIDYQNKQLVTSQSVTTLQDGTANFSFSDVEKGSYDIVARGVDARRNTVVARYAVHVGDQRASVETKQYTLTATAQKNTYNANETANITVSANFTVSEAVVAITNASEGFSHIVSLSKNTIEQTSWDLPIQVKEEYGEQLGIDVFAVQNGSVVLAHTNIDIARGEKRIKTAIAFDKQTYAPKDKVTATITTKDQQGNPVASDTSLAVIDASILQIGQLNGDIFETFYSTYPSYTSVSHFDSTSGIYTQLGGGGGGCFLKGTKIAMADGTSKNIEEITVGDTILTRVSDQSSKLVEDTVVKTFRHAVTDYLTINGVLHVTPVHRIYINGEWREAGDARVGDTLLDLNGNLVTITSIVPNVGQFLVYNLETMRYHTFFADGFYVHNDKGERARQNFADTAYWNPHIKTDTNGKATISFALPDNLTTFTAQVFANSKDSQFGKTTESIVSEKIFNIIPAVAQFYYEGDKPVISALLQNASKEDIDANVMLTIKELGFSKNATANVAKGDIAQVTFPVALSANMKTISFVIEAKDSSGLLLDLVKLTRPILPKGIIVPLWMSFTGSKNIDFTATYPPLDFNKITVTVVPNIAASLFQNNLYFNSDASISTGKSLYAYSYILAKTREGLVSPTAYQYATFKNDFRQQVSSLLKTRHTVWTSQYYQNESYIAMNLWLAKGLEQAATVGELNEISNVASIVQEVKQYIRSTYPKTGGNGQTNSPPPLGSVPIPYSFDEQLTREWVLGEQTSDPLYKDSVVSFSVQALNGNVGALDKLRSLRVLTADDRYLWDGDTTDAQIFPAFAMIEKGSISDAEKAVKGLSFAKGSYSVDPLVVLAGIKYAEKINAYVDQPSIKVTVNGQVLFEAKEEQVNGNIEYTLLPKNAEDGKISLAVDAKGEVPVYTTIVQTDFQSNTNQVKFGDAKVIDTPITRSFKDIQTGSAISEITQGQSAVVVLTMQNVLRKYQNREYGYDAMYAFTLEDAISPAFMFLNQLGEGSPQYESALDRLFPSLVQYQRTYVSPRDYTDEEVIFSGGSSEPTIIMPYVVYAISNGTHYQPKTSIVFPVLGLIAFER